MGGLFYQFQIVHLHPAITAMPPVMALACAPVQLIVKAAQVVVRQDASHNLFLSSSRVLESPPMNIGEHEEYQEDSSMGFLGAVV